LVNAARRDADCATARAATKVPQVAWPEGQFPNLAQRNPNPAQQKPSPAQRKQNNLSGRQSRLFNGLSDKFEENHRPGAPA
jgi:hypothetical protein